MGWCQPYRDWRISHGRLGADGKYHWHWDPTRRRARGDQQAHRERLHTCAHHLNVPTLLVRGGLSDVLSEAGAQSFLKNARTSNMSTWQMLPIWSLVIAMTSSQNPPSPSSRKSHHRAERRTDLTYQVQMLESSRSLLKAGHSGVG